MRNNVLGMVLDVWITHYKSPYIFARDCYLIQAPLVLLHHSFDDLYCRCCRCVALSGGFCIRCNCINCSVWMTFDLRLYCAMFEISSWYMPVGPISGITSASIALGGLSIVYDSYSSTSMDLERCPSQLSVPQNYFPQSGNPRSLSTCQCSAELVVHMQQMLQFLQPKDDLHEATSIAL